eukprot:s467_g11.t1
MGAFQSHAIFALWQLADPADGFSHVQCAAPVCPKDKRPVRKLNGPKIWAFGCDVPEGNRTLHRCCVDKEICMRTCGMPWKKCGRLFEKCAEKVCDMDEDCIAVAEEADVIITGGTSHFAVCKAYRDAQQQLCDCLGPEAAQLAAVETRLTEFYAAYVPQRLVDGKVKDIEEVWKKWQSREAELFYELARKYRAEAVEMRLHLEADLDRLRNANKQEAQQQAEAKLEEVSDVHDETTERLRQRLAEEEALAEKEISQRKALLADLEAAKASAVAAEDFMRAKEVKHQLDLLAAQELVNQFLYIKVPPCQLSITLAMAAFQRCQKMPGGRQPLRPLRPWLSVAVLAVLFYVSKHEAEPCYTQATNPSHQEEVLSRRGLAIGAALATGLQESPARSSSFIPCEPKMPELPIRAISATQPLNIPNIQPRVQTLQMGQSQGYVFNGGAWIPSENVAAMPCPSGVPVSPDQAKPVDPKQATVSRSISVHPPFAYPATYVRISPRSVSPTTSPRNRAGSVASPRRLMGMSMLGAKETMQAAASYCSLSEEVRNFLNDNGFGYYAEAFRMNGFEDMETVVAMTQEQLQRLKWIDMAQSCSMLQGPIWPGHVLKLDAKLDQFCEQKGLPKRGKHRFQFQNPPPWLPIAAQRMAASPNSALSPGAAAACFAGMMPRQQQIAGPEGQTISIFNSTNTAACGGGCLPQAAGAEPGGFPKLALKLRWGRKKTCTPSPVDKDIHEISAGWTDGREWAVPTVDEESEHDSPRSPRSEMHLDVGSGIQDQEGSSSEPAPTSISPAPTTSASPSTSTTCTFTPHPARANYSFNSGISGAGVFAFPPRRDQFGSGCTSFSVQTAPPGSSTPGSVRFGSGQRKLKRTLAAHRKVFTWLQQNRFSNVNAERWFLGRAYFPLHAAVRENLGLERPLLKASLKCCTKDPLKKNSGGMTPLDYAQSKQRSSVICDILQDYESHGCVQLSKGAAIFGLFEGPNLVAYTMPGVFNVSMPPEYVLKKTAPGLLAWQGDRIQPVEVMTAKSKAVEFTTLAEALGANATEVGERMAKVRPSVRVNTTVEASLVEALVDPAEKGLDTYQFEFVSDFIHELKLYALLKAEGKNYLCSVNLRTPALLWEDRQEKFRGIMATLTPLEPQPNRTSTA